MAGRSIDTPPCRGASPIALVLALGLILLVVAVFGVTTGFGFVQYDDVRYVRDNRALAQGLTPDFLRFAVSLDPAAIHQGVSNWHPLTWLSYGLDVTLFGVDPGAMHGVNVAFHALNTLLVFALFARTTRAPVASAAVAALFAIHPLHVEPVAWIAERKELVAAFFGLLACHAWAEHARSGRRSAWFAVVTFAALSLLAKPMWVTLPFLLLALDHWPLERRDPDPVRRAARLAPLLALSLASSAITLYAQRGALDAATPIPLWARIENAIAAPIAYLRLTVWPDALSVIHPHPSLPGGEPPTLLGWLGIGIAWLAIGALAWVGRGRGYVVAGLAWFLIALAPVIGLVQVGEQAFAERYTYVPLIGIFALVAFGIRDLFAARGRAAKAAGALFGSAALALLAVRCADQVGAWRDTITLYERSLASTPNSARLHFNLANRLLDRGQEKRAISHFEAARRLRPDWADPAANLAWLLATTDDPALLDPARAVALALEVTAAVDADANALDTLAAAHASAGDFARAEASARRAVELARAAGRLQSARVYEGRRRLYARGKRYVEPSRPEEGAPARAAGSPP